MSSEPLFFLQGIFYLFTCLCKTWIAFLHMLFFPILNEHCNNCMKLGFGYLHKLVSQLAERFAILKGIATRHIVTIFSIVKKCLFIAPSIVIDISLELGRVT